MMENNDINGILTVEGSESFSKHQHFYDAEYRKNEMSVINLKVPDQIRKMKNLFTRSSLLSVKTVTLAGIKQL